MIPPESRPDVRTRSEKSSEKILQILAESPQLTIADLAKEVGIGTRAIEKQLANLQEAGHLSRIGELKEGYWQVTGKREK